MTENDGMNDLTPGSGEDPPHRPRPQTLALFIGIALIVATLANGAGVYLRKLGIIEPEAYRTYWALQCNGITQGNPITGTGEGCSTYVKENPPHHLSREDILVMWRIARSVYETPAREIPLKLAKDALGVAVIVLSAWLIMRRKTAWPAAQKAWPLLLLLSYVICSFIASWAAHGTMTAMAGLRPFMFLVMALVCGWLAPHMAVVAQCLAVLLGTEALLVTAEMFNVKQMIGHVVAILPSGSYVLATRASGTLILPNTLGIFAATGLAFYYTFSRTRSYLPIVAGVALMLILAGGSATGLLCMLYFLFFIAIERIEPQRRRFAMVAGILACLAVIPALPVITGRPGLFDSIVGEGQRLDVFRYALADKNLLELLFGRGIGLNTNLALNLLNQAPPDALAAAGTLIPPPTDSTVTSLIVQIGILGTLLFYGSLLWAALHDPGARMFYVIIVLCSLTLNIPEVFPVNLLLGIVLARSLTLTRSK